MASFTTRVELHSATETHYATLHAELERRGFSRLIRADDGTWYHLPTAEYNYDGAATIDTVFGLAEASANSTGRNSWILVTESVRRRFKLAPVK